MSLDDLNSIKSIKTRFMMYSHGRMKARDWAVYETLLTSSSNLTSAQLGQIHGLSATLVRNILSKIREIVDNPLEPEPSNKALEKIRRFYFSTSRQSSKVKLASWDMFLRNKVQKPADSLRVIARIYGINYVSAHRKIKEVEEIVGKFCDWELLYHDEDILADYMGGPSIED